MNILVLTSTYPRWENDTDPKFVEYLCQHLGQDNQVHVVAPHTRGTATEEMKDGIRVFRYRYCIERWETLAYDGGILPRLKQNKFRILLVPFFLLSQWFTTVRLLRRNNYDVIHAHWIIPQGLVALLARPFAKVPPILVATSHGGDLFALKGGAFAQLKRWVTKRVDHLTVVSSTMKAKAVDQQFKDSNKISVIPMGVDSQDMFTPPPQGSLRKGLLFVGRLVDKKGVEYLLQALPKILEKYPDETLVIIGSGPLETSLKSLCQRLGVVDRVLFLGSLVNTDIPDYLRSSAITIFPSVVADDGDQEGTPVAIMEALACECAIIVSDYPGARDIIEDGVNGYLVAQRSVEGLVERICSLLADPRKQQQLGKNGRKHVQTLYDWRVISDNFETVFKLCAAG